MKILNKITHLLFTFLVMQATIAQTSTPVGQLPVNIVTAVTDTSKPMIMYITGDGGWNKFSKGLSAEFAAKGYPVVALNSKEYFWKKKTAEQTSLDVANLIRTYQKTWSRKKIILVGYSFGADVMPFVFNQLPADLSAGVININLLSPSPNTDFEVHLAVMFGAGFTGGESVVAAINKITAKPMTILFGKGEDDFPLTQLKIKNYTSIVLDGGHHYDGDENKVCNTILQHLPKN
ncbi:MAG: AcvB/VirJ family lysyl-phosphatidylglycerol hydrolase [Ferruginibacter sp.]